MKIFEKMSFFLYGQNQVIEDCLSWSFGSFSDVDRKLPLIPMSVSGLCITIFWRLLQSEKEQMDILPGEWGCVCCSPQHPHSQPKQGHQHQNIFSWCWRYFLYILPASNWGWGGSGYCLRVRVNRWRKGALATAS